MKRLDVLEKTYRERVQKFGLQAYLGQTEVGTLGNLLKTLARTGHHTLKVLMVPLKRFTC